MCKKLVIETYKKALVIASYKKALIIAAFLGLIETILFISYSVFLSHHLANGIVKTFYEIFFSELGSLFMAILTTFYVVFTYYLLKTADFSWRQNSEPYVRLDLISSDNGNGISVQDPLIYSNEIECFFNSLGMAAKPVDGRYKNIKLLIYNVKDINIGYLKITYDANLICPDRLVNVNKITGEWVSNDSWVLEGQKSEELLLFDLSKVPQYDCMLQITIRSAEYHSTNVPELVVRNFGGTGSRAFNGVAEYNAKTSDQQQPIIEKGT